MFKSPLVFRWAKIERGRILIKAGELPETDHTIDALKADFAQRGIEQDVLSLWQRRDHPTDALAMLKAVGWQAIQNAEPPSYNQATQVAEVSYSLEDGVPVAQWNIRAITQADIDAHNNQVRLLRQSAFAKEADVLGLKAMRGEATVEQYQAKVAEIRERLPYLELPAG
jgi:hypothetical protein